MAQYSLNPNCYIENNTWVCGNMEYISSVDQDMSRVSKVNEWDILSNTKNKFHIYKFIVLFIIYKLAPLPTSINTNAFHDNRHMWDYHELSYNLFVAETSIKHSILYNKKDITRWHKNMFSWQEIIRDIVLPTF